MTARLIGRTGKVRGADAPVADGLTMGSGPENALRIQSRTVSRRHAQIVRTGTQYYLEDLGSRNVTFLNGQRVKRFPIQHLDVLSLGPDADLIFMESGTAAPAVARVAALRATIVWIDGPLAGKVEEVAAGRGLILGRRPDLPLPSISRRHAALTIRDNHVALEDLGSANGTLVNGKAISTVVTLADGDEVSLGDMVRCKVAVLRGVSEDTLRFMEGTGRETMVVGDLPGARRDPVLEVPQTTVSSAARATQAPPAHDTIMEPRAPLVLPSLGSPSGDVRNTFSAPPEGAGGLPGALAARARAARDAVDATFAAPASAAPDSPAAAPATPISPLPGAGVILGVRLEGPQALTLNQGSFEIGRHPDCEIHLDLRDVGRKHARLTVTGEAVTIEDLGSANGTFVNDAPISESRSVPDGARVRFASVEFRVTYVRQ